MLIKLLFFPQLNKKHIQYIADQKAAVHCNKVCVASCGPCDRRQTGQREMEVYKQGN